MSLIQKTIESIEDDGLKATLIKIARYILKRNNGSALNSHKYEPFMDVLFINGCDPTAAPHPPRYRIAHQKEQLLANNIVSNEVYYTDLRMEQVRNYRVFIFFRCPFTPLIGSFIEEAKRLHKTVLFDVDDLVIDTKYTDNIPFVKSLESDDKKIYDDGVQRMGKTLSLCDAAITTTERLAQELRNYVPEVFINRNRASERMLRLSEKFLQEKGECRGTLDGIGGNGSDLVHIGYFSGSITHNADFEMILPALLRILEEYENVRLHIVGELTVCDELNAYKSRIITNRFVKWEKLPALIGAVDINLAPIERTIFNEAKSENKWVEAALVKVPTIASNVGAFKEMITQNETGILCDSTEDWYNALKRLIEEPSERKRIAENAYKYCRRECVTIYTGFPLAKYIRGKMRENVAFVLPSLEISGGIMVAMRHASYLYDEGKDVFVISENPGTGWFSYNGHTFPVISRNHHSIHAHIDKAVATMWTTTQFLETYPNIGKRYYLVQCFETDFYTPEVFLRIQANQSYSPSQSIQFLTISKWCKDWLLKSFEKESRYAPNGIDSRSFYPHRRRFDDKVRILIEGDCAVYYKNIDESFKIAQALDSEKYEIWYMSYNAEPKQEYRVDRFFHKVPYEKVFEVYGQCDILVKSSILEGFSYPPLEMMATGGYVVVAPNEGNTEYLENEINCLMYEQGDIEAAVRAITRLCEDQELRETLYQNGLKTARERDWENVRAKVLSLYDD